LDIDDLKPGLKPTSPVICEVGVLEIDRADRIANCADVRRLTGRPPAPTAKLATNVLFPLIVNV
jgi:hypothetical protein